MEAEKRVAGGFNPAAQVISLSGFEFSHQQMGRVGTIRRLNPSRFWRWLESFTGIAFVETKYDVVIGNLMIRINQDEYEQLQELRAADQKVREVWGMVRTLGFRGQ